jgi:hypothetical protein
MILEAITDNRTMTKTIFLIAVLHGPDDLSPGGRKRTWGWYEKFADAEEVVLLNQTDIFENGYYDMAVIEEMPEGVLAVEENSWWYRATYTKDSLTVEKTERPEKFQQTVCLTIG